MVEVFKTNVHDYAQANLLVAKIHQVIPGSQANFDLDDCDKILRIVYVQSTLNVKALLELFQDFGFSAEILCHDIPANTLLNNVLSH